MVASRRQFAVFVFLVAVAVAAFPTLAIAATADFRVLIDLDNSGATGCAEGGVTGVEQIFVTRVVTGASSAQTTRTYRQVCSAGVFGPPVDLDLTPRPAGFHTPSGAILAESRIPFSALGSGVPLNLHLAFDATDGFSTQHVLTQPNGVRILFPTVAGRRHSVTNPGNPRTMVLDGLPNDWEGIPPLVNGVANDGTVAVRILKIYAFANTADDFLYFRFDGFIDNSNPYAQDDTYARKPGEGLSIVAPGVLANDGDPTGHPLTATPVSPAEHGDVTLNPDGSFTYAPDDPTSLTSDKFDYKASNGTKESNVARVTIKVSSHPSQGPTAVDDAYTTQEDTTLTVPAPGVLGNDVDPDGPSLTAALLTNPAHGTVVLSSNGAFTYKPSANFNGTDTFTYRVSDGTSTDDAVVTITISAVNDAPVAQNLSRTTNEEVPVSVTLSATDTEPGTLTYTVVTNPSNGVLSGSAPNLTYTPNPNFFGTDSFTYRATDSGGKPSNTATVTITVNPVNDAPSFACGPNVLADSSAGAATFPNWATAISAGPANESSQTLTFEITANSNPALFSAQPAVSSNGTLTFTPAVNATGSANITIRLRDNGGTANGGVDTSASCSFTITVDAPPSVTTSVPTNGATGVAANANVTINFSELVNASGASFTVSCATSGSHTFTTSASPSASFTLDPTADFTQGETCTVTVLAAGVTDGDTNDPPDNMAANYVFSFTVDAAPSVTSTTPTNGATNVGGATNITVNFSEPVNASGASFTVSCTTSGAHTFTTSSSPSASFTLDPTADFTQGETCTVTVLAAGITDADTNDPPDNMLANYVFSFTIDAAPSVTAVTPTNGSITIANNTNLSVTFSEPVTITNSSVTVNCGTSGAHTVTVSGGPTTWTVNPDTDFANGELCTATVLAAGVSDNDANDPPDNMLANFVWSFTTDTPPSVTATTPVNAATSSPDTNITVTFDEAVNATTSSFTISCTTSGAHTFALSGGPTTFTLDPATDFTGGETCTVTVVAAQVTDADAGDPPDNMTANYVFSFGVDAAPSVTSTTPANGASQVAANTDVTINFSESVNATGSSFDITCATSGVHTFTTSASPGTTFTLNPNSDFTAGETCTVTVFAAGVTDADAFDPPDNMAANYVFSFTVDAAPSVTSTTPANGATDIGAATNVTINFSESVNATGASFDITCATSGAHTFSTSSSPGASFTLDPTADFTQGETCTVTVFAAGVTDADAFDPPDTMLSNYVFSFTIDAAPSVTAVTPVDLATNVATNTNLSITFSEPVTITNSSVTISCGTTGSHTVTVSGGPTTWTVNPDSDFSNGELCTATVLAAQVSDNDTNDPPNNMTANFVWSFTTDNPPGVTSTTPVNAGVGAPSDNITVTFDEAVNATASSFGISCTSSGAHTFVLSGGPTTFTLNPDTDFSGGETCTVTVTAAQVTDQDAGDPPDNMVSDYVFSFGIDAAPTVVSTSPNNGDTNKATNVNLVITYSEPVTATGTAYTITCTPSATPRPFVLSGNGTAVHTLDPNINLSAGQTCTVNILATQITDVDTNDPPDNMAANYSFSFTTDANPQIIALSPNDGSTIATNQNTNITWTEPVTMTTVQIVCTVSGSHTSVLSTSDNITWTVNPDTDYTQGESCTITVFSASVTDIDTNDPPDNPGPDISWTYTVDSAPAVTSTTPADLATQQANNTNITVNFNESVSATTSSFTISCVTSGSHTYALSSSPASAFTLNPDTDFTNGEQCTVTVVAAQIADQDSADPPNNMAANYGFTFTVDVPPSVTSTTPANSGVIGPTGTITVNFNESVNATTSSFTVDCGGAQSYTLSASPSNTFTLTPTTSWPATACTLTVFAAQITDADAGDPPDNMVADVTVNFTVNTPPTAVDDSDNAIGNLTLTVADAGGVLANDSDPDTGSSISIAPANQGPLTGSAGGTITFTSGGGYTYHSQAGDANVDDLFTYTVTDNNGATATATLTIHIGPRYIFVDDDGPGVPDGRDISPFKTLQQAEAGSAAGDTLVIKAGSYTDFITLKSGQVMYGDGASTTLSTTFNTESFTILVPSGTHPALKRSTAGNTITLNANNALSGIDVSASSGGAAIGGTNFGTLTTNENTRIGVSTTNPAGALALDTGTLAATFPTVNSTGGTSGISLTSCAGNLTIQGGTLTGATGDEIVSTGTTPSVNVTFSGNLTYGGTGNAVNVTATSGVNSGNFTFDTGTMSVTGGTAISVVAATGTHNYYTTTGTATINGAAAGVNLGVNANGTYNFGQAATPSSFTITNTTGTCFNIGNNPAAKVTYNGNMTQANAAALINVVSLNASGNMTFQNGTLSATNGSGVTLSDTDGPVAFNGTMNLSGTAGVLINKGSGGTITFGANTNITSTGTAFSVRGDGVNAPAVNGAITFSGTINKTSSGLLFEVNTLSGSLTFNGPTLMGAFGGPGAVTATVANLTGTLTANHLSLDSSEAALANTVTLLSISGVNTGTMNFHHMVLSANGATAQGAGLVATGGGTLNITNTGGNSSITTRDAIALSLNGQALTNGSAINAIAVAGGANTTNAIAMTNVTGGTFTIAGGSIAGATGATFLVSGGTASVTDNGTITQANANPAVSITGHATGTLTFGGNVTGSVDGADLFFDNADGTYNFNATNALTAGAGINITNGSGGTFAFSANTSVTNGLVDATDNACFRVDTSAPGITYSGNLTKNGTVTGRLVDIRGQASGTITFQTGTLSATSTSATSTGIGLDNADGTVNFNGTTTLNGGDAGVDITNGSTGTFSFGTGASITNVSGTAFAIGAAGAGACNLTYAGTIYDNTGALLSINGETGGTKSFTGAIDDLDGTTDPIGGGAANNGGGISLTNNTGATITFSGGLDLSTGATAAFAATTGGTINICDENPCAPAAGALVNKIATTSGTALNINGVTIGANNAVFQRIDHNGNNTAVSLTNTGAGTLTVTGVSSTAGTGGTIQNIVGADAITLTTTGGLVTLKNMIIQDITAASDAGDPEDTHSNVDAIHGQTVNGGLTLNNVTIQRISDNGINGTVNGLPPTSTVWNGLTLTNCTFTNTNRFNTAHADANNESAVHIWGIKGTVSVTGSSFSNAGSGLRLWSDTSGTLDVTIQSNSFTTLYKEIGTLSVGLYGIDIRQFGTLTSTVRIGDAATESNAALGNTFTNGGDRASIDIIADTGSTGAMKTSIAKNTFTVTDHSSPGFPPGSTQYNFPQGGVLFRAITTGNFEAIFAANVLNQVMHADGGLGQLSIILEKGDSEVIVRNNTFQLPWDAPIELRADGATGGQNSAKVQFTGNQYLDGTVGDGTTDLGGQSPYEAFYAQVRNNGRMDLTIQNESPFGLTDTSSPLGTFSFYARTTTAGDILSLFLQNTKSPRGYQLNAAAGTTYNLFRNGSASGTAQLVLQDNGNTGGGGVDGTVPPTTNTPGAGTVTLSNTAPLLPSITPP